MVYDPKLQKWAGNEHVLKLFEATNATNTPPRPALISHFSTVKGVQVVGGMVFDPVAMKWLDMSSEDGADQEDPFEGMDDLKDDGDVTAAGGTSNNGRLSRSSLSHSKTSEWTDGDEFKVTSAWKKQQESYERTWRSQVRGWDLSETQSRRERLMTIYNLLNSTRSR